LNSIALILDVDDTLYLERDYVHSGFIAVGQHLARLGIEGFAETAWRLFVSGARGDTFDRALRMLGEPSNATRMEELVHVYRTHRPHIVLLPDAATVINACQQEGFRVGIVTDGPPASQRRKLVALGIDDRTDASVVTAEFGPSWHKPSSLPFQRIEELLGSGHDFIYVADNPQKDFQGPISLGWRTFRVRRPGSLHEALSSKPDVDAEAPDLTSLLDWLLDV
jgi:putative hydrolase of the HAD superfamily